MELIIADHRSCTALHDHVQQAVIVQSEQARVHNSTALESCTRFTSLVGCGCKYHCGYVDPPRTQFGKSGIGSVLFGTPAHNKYYHVHSGMTVLWCHCKPD